MSQTNNYKSRKRFIIFSSAALAFLLIVWLFLTQSYRAIPYMPFKIATCPFEDNLYVDVYHELPYPAFPGQGSDASLYLVVRNWWGQVQKEADIFKFSVKDIRQPCGENDLAYVDGFRGVNWKTVLPLWRKAPVEVSPDAIIINKNKEVLFLHLSPGTRPDTTWPRGGLFKGSEDPKQFILMAMQERLPFNIISIKEASRYDFKRDDGSIHRRVTFVVLVEQKPGTTMADLPPTTPNGIPATYKWYPADSEYAKKEMQSVEQEKIFLSIEEMVK